MNKILTIIQREYITRVRRRVFIITTILFPVGLLFVSFSRLFFANYYSETINLAVVDESGIFKSKLISHSGLFYSVVDSPYEDVKKTYQRNYTGILYVPSDFNLNSQSGIQLYSNNQIGFVKQQTISDDLTKIVRAIKLSKLQIKQDTLDEIDKSISIDAIIANANGEKKGNTDFATGMGYVMGFLIYFIMFIYGAMVMRGVMEEKTNRISEVIISSVKPFQLMIGKIIGIGLVGLTQFLIWIILVFGTLAVLGTVFHDQLAALHANNLAANYPGQSNANQYIQGLSTVKDSLNNLPMTEIISCFIFYFFGGYLLYSALFAAVGSAAGDDPGETQSLSLIVTLPIVISFIIMINVLQEPNSTLAVITSLIPFCTPIVMSARIPFGVPAWQIAASMVSLIIGFLFTTWLAGKIYRTGILMYGKKVTFKELGKWLFYKN